MSFRACLARRPTFRLVPRPGEPRLAAPFGALCVVPSTTRAPAQFPPCAMPRLTSHGSPIRGPLRRPEHDSRTGPVSALCHAQANLGATA
eukprot:1058959-Alexandrium_andersonii.AAC.1